MENGIVPCLWFSNQAQEAVQFYCATFKNSKLKSNNPFVSSFDISGVPFIALNGGSTFNINESISFFVYCGSDAEITRLYEELMAGGTALFPLEAYPWSKKYAWVKDKFGVSWQLDIDTINNKQTIVPTLLFVNEKATQVESAIAFYQSIFPKSKTIMKAFNSPESGLPEDSLLFAQFKLNGYIMNAMSSSLKHDYGFNEAVSMVIHCEDQAEIDHFWDSLISNGGIEGQCGWCKDQFGISWQIVPSILSKLMGDKTKASKVSQTLMKMKKIEIAELLNC